ncbi:GGDEF domain-containing protein [Brevibacillus choshinensis]|uniref:GGDEF domain-containing protein n=1 Tax=Brevibacillus choshinensis TaxID=54911 RepID=A0ABX7FKI8_BRECH|nr:GGDEF domain-containing protein [Brevibacillus choshinensis]QRG65515.1 GGDEF domain-containing protein [Brevibacillus choshinensis]
MKISEIMTTSAVTITSDKSVSHAAEQMKEYSTNYLVVVDHGELMGIVTSRHVGSAHPNRIVADAMDEPPMRMAPERNIWDAHRLLHEGEGELLLVMNQEEWVGVVTKEAIQMKLAEFLDPLTGLYRAPYILDIGEKWLEEKKPFHLMFIDVNDFGLINKQYGHPFGDDVIRSFSSLLSSLMEEDSDHVCRYAGDEFILLTTGSEEKAQRWMEAIIQPAEIYKVTVSAAVGHIDGFREPDFFAKTLRDHIAKASLLSTDAKKKKTSLAP